MVAHRNRIDEVLSAGLARMRLEPTGGKNDKRKATSDAKAYWEDLKSALEMAKVRNDQERDALEYLETVRGDEIHKQLKREEEANANYSLDELIDAYRDYGGRKAAMEQMRRDYDASRNDMNALKNKQDTDDYDEELWSEFLEALKNKQGDDDYDEELWSRVSHDLLLQTFAWNGDAVDRLHSDDPPLQVPKRPRLPVDNTRRNNINKIKREFITNWVNEHPLETLKKSDPIVTYLMEDLDKLGTGPITWESIKQTWRYLNDRRRLGPLIAHGDAGYVQRRKPMA